MENQYDLVVIQPIKNKPGRRVCGLSVHGKNVTEAIKKGREWFEGSGYAVMQAAQFNSNVRTTEGEKEEPDGQHDEALEPVETRPAA